MRRQKFGQFTRLKIVGGEFRFNIPGRGLTLFEHKINHFVRQAKNARPMLADIGDAFLDEVDRSFEIQSGVYAWQPLSPRYAERKRRAVGGKPILVYSGKMRRSIRKKVTARTVQITSNRKVRGVNLFQIHQNSRLEWIRKPPLVRPRQIAVIRDKRRIERIVRTHLLP